MHHLLLLWKLLALMRRLSSGLHLCMARRVSGSRDKICVPASRLGISVVESAVGQAVNHFQARTLVKVSTFASISIRIYFTLFGFQLQYELNLCELWRKILQGHAVVD